MAGVGAGEPVEYRDLIFILSGASECRFMNMNAATAAMFLRCSGELPMPTAIWNVRGVTRTRSHYGFRRLPRAAVDRVRADSLERGRCGQSGRTINSADNCVET